MERRSFFKKIGITAGVFVVTPSVAIKQIVKNVSYTTPFHTMTINGIKVSIMPDPMFDENRNITIHCGPNMMRKFHKAMQDYAKLIITES